MDDKRLTLFAGHYGSGKTNIAVSYAMKLARENKKVIIADLDIVNPYFRTKDSDPNSPSPPEPDDSSPDSTRRRRTRRRRRRISATRAFLLPPLPLGLQFHPFF